MVTAYVTALHRPISSVRLETYRPPNGSDLEMLINYLWNIELNEALYPTLQAFEVSLRNTIHSTLSTHYSTEFWFDEPDVLLHYQIEAVKAARYDLKKKNKPRTAGRIVAALTFGFWTSLLNRSYDQPQPNLPANRLYWHDANNQPTLLLQAFPNLTRRYMTRGKVFNRLNETRDLRNRVFHHEPIWHRQYLRREHRLILNAIGWISPEMREAVLLCDRFLDVHQQGKARIETAVKAHLLIP